MKCSNGTLDGGISKFFNDEIKLKIINDFDINDNEILFIIGDLENIVLHSLGALRLVARK